MSYLLKKSDENFSAIDILIASKLYNPVIHCAYYSSLQLIIHYTYEYCGISEEQAQNDINYEGNSHAYFLTNFVNEIEKINRTNASKFYKYFNQFKRKRIEADYYNIELLEVDSNKAKECAKKIRTFLTLICDEGKCENIHLI